MALSYDDLPSRKKVRIARLKEQKIQSDIDALDRENAQKKLDLEDRANATNHKKAMLAEQYGLAPDGTSVQQNQIDQAEETEKESNSINDIINSRLAKYGSQVEQSQSRLQAGINKQAPRAEMDQEANKVNDNTGEPVQGQIQMQPPQQQ